MAPSRTPPPTIDPHAVLLACRRFAQGMRTPGRVLIALIAATFGTTWQEAEALLALAEAQEVRDDPAA